MTDKFDPTANRVPFGLLTDEERKTLKSWPHGVEYFSTWREWRKISPVSWLEETVYRGRLVPTCEELIARLRSCSSDEAMWLIEAANRIEQLNAKLAKAVALIEDAYCNGFAEGSDGTWVEGDYTKPWLRSDIYKNLKEITGERDE
jgi:hypothetical protein